MKNETADFVRSIVSYITKEKELPLNKTKLLKILYLIDVEYYRFNDRQLFDFQWKYFKYGPYDHDYDVKLRNWKLNVADSDMSHFIDVTNEYDFNEEVTRIIPNTNTRTIIKRIVDQFSEYDLNKLLDFVYFYTEPMEDVVMNQPLDFSKIVKENIPYQRIQYAKSNSDKLKQLKNLMKSKKAQVIDFLENENQKPKSDAYYEQMASMDSDNAY